MVKVATFEDLGLLPAKETGIKKNSIKSTLKRCQVFGELDNGDVVTDFHGSEDGWVFWQLSSSVTEIPSEEGNSDNEEEKKEEEGNEEEETPENSGGLERFLSKCKEKEVVVDEETGKETPVSEGESTPEEAENKEIQEEEQKSKETPDPQSEDTEEKEKNNEKTLEELEKEFDQLLEESREIEEEIRENDPEFFENRQGASEALVDALQESEKQDIVDGIPINKENTIKEKEEKSQEDEGFFRP